MPAQDFGSPSQPVLTSKNGQSFVGGGRNIRSFYHSTSPLQIEMQAGARIQIYA